MATNNIFSHSIRVNPDNRTIEVTKAFDKASRRFGTPEYDALQTVRRDYPDFPIKVKTVRSGVDHFYGLTYDFMEKYIASHDDADGTNMATFNDLRGKSDSAVELKAAAQPYGKIRAWFLKTYPAFDAFTQRCEDALAA